MDIAAEHRDDEGRHLVLSTAKRRYRLNICGETTETEPLAYVLPGDAFWETRQAAVSDFHEHCHLGHVKKLPFCLAPGPSEHWRLVQWLRLLEASSTDGAADVQPQRTQLASPSASLPISSPAPHPLFVSLSPRNP